MARDLLLEELFDNEPAWDKAIIKGLGKHIKQGVLEQFSAPAFREKLKSQIANHDYHVAPPHEAQVPKDDGTLRTVYANDARDRVLMTAVNDALFRLCPDMIHPTCKSYQTGIGCGIVAKQVSRDIQSILSENPDIPELGRKLDLSKYFDSVPIEIIDDVFDQVESRVGHSAVIDLCREYYHDDTLVGLDGKKFRKYTSLRQGCAVAAFLADTVLEPVDRAMHNAGLPYYRYSDDILLLGPDTERVFPDLKAMLDDMSLTLNPKKIEILSPDKWFTFLGFSLKHDLITLSKKRVGNFQAAIEKRTIKHAGAHLGSGPAMRRVAGYLYDSTFTGYGYAEGILPIVNSRQDLMQLDLFILDCLRACDTGRYKLGGLGWDRYKSGGAISRGRGRNVAANREKRPHVENYVPLSHMQAAFLHSRPAYEAYANAMRCP